jgi:hypothetical protein
MKREDVIREIMSMIDAGGYQVARAILKLAEKPEGTFQKIGPRSRRRSMSQAEAKRLVDKARARIELVDSTD